MEKTSTEDPPQLLEELKLRFLGLVFGEKLHPQDAAKRLGIPYPKLLEAKEADPELGVAWKGTEERALERNRVRNETVLDIAEKFVKALANRGQLFEKAVDFVEEIDIKTEQGKKDFKWCVQYGLLRDTMPKFTAATIEHRHQAPEKFGDLGVDELIRMLEDKVGSVIRLKLEEEFATKTRLELGGIDRKVRDVEFEPTRIGHDAEADSRAN